MSNDKCERCDGRLMEIDHYGERLKGCLTCNSSNHLDPFAAENLGRILCRRAASVRISFKDLGGVIDQC
jgi:hypothetical protein